MNPLDFLFYFEIFLYNKFTKINVHGNCSLQSTVIGELYCMLGMYLLINK